MSLISINLMVKTHVSDDIEQGTYSEIIIATQKGASFEETPVHNLLMNNEGVTTYCTEVSTLTIPYNR